VFDAAAKLGNWTSAPASGRYRGIAIGAAFNSIVAEVVEISSVTSTSLRVNRVSCAIDCYLSVNPGQIQAQLQGGIVHGLNAALYGQQTFVNGAAQAANFNRSRMVRMGEMPQIDITVIPSPAVADRTANIGGVGETRCSHLRSCARQRVVQGNRQAQVLLTFLHHEWPVTIGKTGLRLKRGSADPHSLL
jgi:isoquinoline 1-oxidoreductase subunit beta